MMVWKMSFLFQGARILRFHVNLPGCKWRKLQTCWRGEISQKVRCKQVVYREMQRRKKYMRMCNVFGRLIFVDGIKMDEIPSLFSNCGIRDWLVWLVLVDEQMSKRWALFPTK